VITPTYLQKSITIKTYDINIPDTLKMVLGRKYKFRTTNSIIE